MFTPGKTYENKDHVFTCEHVNATHAFGMAENCKPRWSNDNKPYPFVTKLEQFGIKGWKEKPKVVSVWWRVYDDQPGTCSFYTRGEAMNNSYPRRVVGLIRYDYEGMNLIKVEMEHL